MAGGARPVSAPSRRCRSGRRGALVGICAGLGGHSEEGNSDVAVSLLERAVAAAEEAGDVEVEARALNGLAVIEQTLGNLDRSEEFYSRARFGPLMRAMRCSSPYWIRILGRWRTFAASWNSRFNPTNPAGADSRRWVCLRTRLMY